MVWLPRSPRTYTTLLRRLYRLESTLRSSERTKVQNSDWFSLSHASTDSLATTVTQRLCQPPGDTTPRRPTLSSEHVVFLIKNEASANSRTAAGQRSGLCRAYHTCTRRRSPSAVTFAFFVRFCHQWLCLFTQTLSSFLFSFIFYNHARFLAPFLSISQARLNLITRCKSKCFL